MRVIDWEMKLLTPPDHVELDRAASDEHSGARALPGGAGQGEELVLDLGLSRAEQRDGVRAGHTRAQPYRAPGRTLSHQWS